MPVAAEVRKIITIPDGVKVEYDPKTGELKVTGPLGTLTRSFNDPRIKIEYKDNHISVICPEPRKKEYALAGTWAAHIKNMCHGVDKGFEYKMKIVYSHFPIKTHIKDDKLLIENFLGEKQPRAAKILGETKVKISGDQIILTGPDLEMVGQSMANIEHATQIKNYDPRVFQDGIYLVEHPKRKSDVGGN